MHSMGVFRHGGSLAVPDDLGQAVVQRHFPADCHRLWRHAARAIGVGQQRFRRQPGPQNHAVGSRIAGSDAEGKLVAGKRARPSDARRRDGRGRAGQECATRDGTTSDHRSSLTGGCDSSRHLLHPTVNGHARQRTRWRAAMTTMSACSRPASCGIKPRNKRAPASPRFATLQPFSEAPPSLAASAANQQQENRIGWLQLSSPRPENDRSRPPAPVPPSSRYQASPNSLIEIPNPLTAADDRKGTTRLWQSWGCYLKIAGSPTTFGQADALSR
jgi:hypothetical protein